MRDCVTAITMRVTQAQEGGRIPGKIAAAFVL